VTKQTIEERISSALNNGSTGSATIAELIKETEAAIEEATATAEQEAAHARDLTCPDPSKADEAARAATLQRDRLLPVLPKLQDKLAAAITSERHAKWLLDYRRIEERARCAWPGIRRCLSPPQCATRRPVARRLDQNSPFKIRRRS
jgi:hypothetical protein